MESSIKLLSSTMQKNPLVMANTIREGFAARPSIEGDPISLSNKRARTSSQVARDDSSGSSHKRPRNMARETCTAQVVVASPSHSEGEAAEDDVSLLDPADSFSDPKQDVATPLRWRNCQETNLPLPFLHGFKQLPSFPHNGKLANDFGETHQREEVAYQKVNTFILAPQVVDQLGELLRVSGKLMLYSSKYYFVTLSADSFVASIFTTKKSDGSHRAILTLKKLNESII